MHDPFIQALIHIHRDIPRKGPGSDALSRAAMEKLLPLLPDDPQIADMGCGNGHGSFLLVETVGGHVTAVDVAEEFIDELRKKLVGHPAATHVTPVVGDMVDPGLAAKSLDLVWSEGAAFAVGLDNALTAWRDLLKPGGLVAFSECCWFTDHPSEEAAAFWAENYPNIGTMGDVVALAESLGYRCLWSDRLPAEDWWTSYYDPLAERLDRLENEKPEGPLAEVIAGARHEAEIFRRFGDEYGYGFFVLQSRQGPREP